MIEMSTNKKRNNLKIYPSDNRTSKYIKENGKEKQINTQLQLESSISLSQQLTEKIYLKISKDIADLNDTINLLDLIDIYRTLHPKSEYMFFFKQTYNIYQNRPISHLLPEFMAKKQASVNLRFQSFNICSVTTMELNQRLTDLKNLQIFGN